MYRPAGFSDSDSDDGWNSDENFDANENKPSRRNIGDNSNANSGTSIDWDALNAASENNNDEVKFDDKKTQKLLDRTKKCIRSILLSSKGGTGIHEIEHQYHELFEEGIAYRKFGFQSLESFLRNLPSVCRVYQLGHMGVMVEGVADSETRHIKMMVSAQGKGKKKGGRRGGGMSRYDDYSAAVRRFASPPRQSSRASSRGRPVNGLSSNSRQVNPPHPANNSRAVNPSRHKLSTRARSSNPPMINSMTVKSASSSTVHSSSSKVNSPEFLKLKKYIGTVIASGRAMSLSSFEKSYKLLVGEDIPYRKYQFDNVVKFLSSLSETCEVKVIEGQTFVNKAKNSSASRSDPSKSSENRGIAEPIESDMMITTDKATIVSRLRELLLGRKFGLLISQVVKLYEKKFSEQLREDWLLWIDDSGFVIERNNSTVPVIKLKDVDGSASVKNAGKSNNNESEVCQSNGMEAADENAIENVETVSRILEKVDLPNVIRSISESVENQVIISEVEKIMKPRKFGLFKIQLKVMFKKNTGEELSEIDLEMLIRQNVLVHHETNYSVLKWRE